MPLVHELQLQCKAAGLNAKGTKAQLTKRLEEQMISSHKNQSRIEPDPSPPCGEAIHDKSKTNPVEEGIKMSTKVALGVVLNDELQVQEVWGTRNMGLYHSLDLAKLEEYCRMIEQHNAQHDTAIASLKQKDTTLQTQINHLDDRLTSLCHTQPEYRQVREIFLSCFKRDILKTPTKRDNNILQTGIITTFVGDITADARLYEGTSARHDSRTFISLYGMTPSDAQKIHHKETIELLNAHATVRAETKKTGSSEYYRRFQEFIESFEQSDHDTNYLNAEPPTDVTRAYWALLSCEQYSDTQ